ncbi:DUF4179 domain-containing protein [Peribacillus sp. SCS-26]|uniref:DUF4179 domain-containing protein n=1 Tax=Paraperibacillus marinus TaxID=3115295 RepID=UPI00390655BB
MNKWAEEQMSGIEVPMDEVMKAIETGMERGRQEKAKRRWISGRKASAAVSAAAAVLLFTSGFLSPSMGSVLASVPVIGGIYEDFHSETGRKLEEAKLVTSLNEKAVSSGVSVVLTSAYYDGNRIGITFKAEGDGLTSVVTDSEPAAGYSHQLFDGSEQKQWSGSMEPLKKKGGSYIGALELDYPGAELPKHFTLPLTFTSMGGQNGTWKFSVPVKQLSAEKIPSAGASQKAGYSFEMKSVIRAHASAVLNYTTTVPADGAEDSFDAEVMDDKGRVLPLSSVSSTQLVLGGKIPDDVKHLMIYPRFNQDEFPAIHPLQKTPFEVKSSRTPYRLTVKNWERAGGKLVVQYQLNDVPGSIKKDVIQNFADVMNLIRTEDEAKGLTWQEFYDHLKPESLIYGNRGRVINEKEVFLESTFVTNGEEKDFSLMVPFGVLMRNAGGVELPPVKIELKN